MRGFIIFIIMFIGLGLVVRTILEFQKHKRYSFKNISIMKKQKIILVVGAIGALIFIVTLWMMVF